MTSQLSTTRYRPEIDGLRAVAVILVILYHLNHSFAWGGFVGVDIFFVISGFVVTRSVLASERNNPLEAMTKFWRRRILRIMPALLLLVIVGTFALATLRPPFTKEGYDGELRTGISAIFGLANLYLHRTGQDYFRADQSANPFVHIWSLGVEEQFYFAFALVFIGVLGIIRSQPNREGVAVISMTVLGIASYGGFLVNAQANPSSSYYFITFRFWEIAAGSLLAYADSRFPGALRVRNAAVSASLQVFAVILLGKVVWLDRPSGFPTGGISIAVGCAVLLIITTKRGAGPIARTLSTPVLVQLGLISYSLYLWHYPVFLFWRTNFGLDNAIQILMAISLVFLAALFSYRVVELPLRHSKISFTRVILPCLVGVIVMEIGVRLGATKTSGNAMYRFAAAME